MWIRLLPLLAALLLLPPAGTPARAVGALPDATTDAFLSDTLDSINRYRARHGVPPLVLDPDLAAYARVRAREWAAHPHLQENHRGLDRGYGENAFWSGTTGPPAASGPRAVGRWYDEIADYDFRSPGFSSRTGHFTQLVWKSTDRVGLARAAGWGEVWYETYVVAVFQPPGNHLGRFPENVPAPAR